MPRLGWAWVDISYGTFSLSFTCSSITRQQKSDGRFPLCIPALSYQKFSPYVHSDLKKSNTNRLCCENAHPINQSQPITPLG